MLVKFEHGINITDYNTVKVRKFFLILAHHGTNHYGFLFNLDELLVLLFLLVVYYYSRLDLITLVTLMDFCS